MSANDPSLLLGQSLRLLAANDCPFSGNIRIPRLSRQHAQNSGHFVREEGWLGAVWPGPAWCGLVCSGLVRSGASWRWILLVYEIGPGLNFGVKFLGGVGIRGKLLVVDLWLSLGVLGALGSGR